MPEAQTIIALIIAGLGALVLFLIKGWSNTWETRLTAQDERLDKQDVKHGEHDVNHAILSANLEHIRETADETRKDVKELLRQSNGRRSTG